MAGYQVMPRMSPERYAALEEDIVANGVQEPIKVSEDGVIVDGHHRDEIARKHDLHCPRIVIKGDAAYLRDRAFVLNSARRDLTSEERRGLVEKSLRSDPILRDSDHARRTGTDPKTVKRIRADKGIPTPDDVIREYIDTHPDENNWQASQKLGISQNTVAKVRDFQKLEVPVFENPAPEPAPMPEWEEVGTIPNSRLDDVAPKRTSPPIISPEHLDQLNQLPTEYPTMEQPEDKPRAEPITNRFTSAIADLNRVTAKFDRIQNDPNFARNKDKVAALHRHDLNRSISELQSIANQLS